MPKEKVSRKQARETRTVPYVKGFRAPTARKQLLAVDSTAGKDGSKIPKEYQASLFDPLPKCSSIDDWLAQYKEDGQSFDQFMQECPWLSNRKRRNVKLAFNSTGSTLPLKYPDGKIYILPLGEFNGGNNVQISDLVEYASIFLSLPIKQLPSVKIEERNGQIFWTKKTTNGEEISVGLKCRYNKKSGRHQLCVDAGLLALREYMPEDGVCMIALTMCDLFEAKSDLFVAGMAAGRDRTAIFSLLRYDPNLCFSKEFWHEISVTREYKPAERQMLMLLRSCRLLVHEVNHLLGIDHCIYYSCCMNGSGHLAEDFRQPMFLCPVDLKKLQVLCGFDVLARYKALKQFFVKHKMSTDVEWLEKRIQYLEI